MSIEDEFGTWTTAPSMKRSKASARNPNPLMRLTGNMPLSRWLLFLGALIALALVFWPWVTISMQESCDVLTCRSFSYPVNPLALYLQVFVYTHPHFARFGAFQEVILIGVSAPGILCSIWIHGRLQTIGQRVGLVTFTLWALLFSGFSVFALYQLVAVDISQAAHPLFIGSWTPSIGCYLLVLALGSLWCGLLLAWRELRQTPMTPGAPLRLHPQSLGAYASAALVTGGLLCWFIGYYGIYWLLPSTCPPTPLFGSAPCNDRLSAQRGYELLFQGHVANTPFYSNFMEFSYWVLGVIIVFGGVALLATLWLRQTASSVLLWIIGWVACFVFLTGISYWGMRHLAVIYPDEQWTNGLLVALFGVLLTVVGLLLRWRADTAHRRPAVYQGV